MGRAGTVVAGTLGAVVTLAAAALVLAPETVQSSPLVATLTESITARDPRVVVVATAALVGLVSLAVSRSGRQGDDGDGARPRLVDRPPEAVAETVGSRPGDAITYRADRAADGDDEAAEAVWETLRTSAVRAVARDPSTTVEDAREAVRDGTWTDDALAAASLGTPAVPLSARFREWLDPEREQKRRVERTAAAIEAIEEET